jgi:ABC-2 type transport system ATP-binding protein
MLAASVSKLTKSYGKNAALRGVDLDVEEGSAWGLIGVNGAGKTTLFKTLLGVVRPTAGAVRVLGGDPDDPEVRARIGYLPERLALPSAWAPVDFLRSVARLKRLGPGAPDVARQLQRVGLTPPEGRTIGSLSKGMKQRLALAAALLGSPALLVLDEPTDGIDPLGRIAFRRIIAEERARGATVLINSHLLAEIERVCETCAILHEGRIVRRGRVEELRRAGSGWTVRFAPGADPDAIAALGFTADGSAWSCLAPDAQTLNDMIDRARAAGALVVELQPSSRELEEVLAESVEPA